MKEANDSKMPCEMDADLMSADSEPELSLCVNWVMKVGSVDARIPVALMEKMRVSTMCPSARLLVVGVSVGSEIIFFK